MATTSGLLRQHDPYNSADRKWHESIKSKSKWSSVGQCVWILLSSDESKTKLLRVTSKSSTNYPNLTILSELDLGMQFVCTTWTDLLPCQYWACDSSVVGRVWQPKEAFAESADTVNWAGAIWKWGKKTKQGNRERKVKTTSVIRFDLALEQIVAKKEAWLPFDARRTRADGLMITFGQTSRRRSWCLPSDDRLTAKTKRPSPQPARGREEKRREKNEWRKRESDDDHVCACVHSNFPMLSFERCGRFLNRQRYGTNTMNCVTSDLLLGPEVKTVERGNFVFVLKLIPITQFAVFVRLSLDFSFHSFKKLCRGRKFVPTMECDEVWWTAKTSDYSK